MKKLNLIFAIILAGCTTNTKKATKENQPSTYADYAEQYRPQFHFSPQKNWMNDPNGMLFFKGIYHLFFQQNPNANVAGNIHWGHATSTDLIHWQQQPTALFPDKLGLIFSGSAVADVNNTSGFGSDGKTPLVALFTSHNVQQEKEGKLTYENQSLAYSLDEGKTWIKYAANPVLNNLEIKDFRDPKVFWYQPQQKWIMALAVKDRVHFYSSKNLKQWTKESEFGVGRGSHAGVWECPDLIQIDNEGKKSWVLLVSINPGAPNGGSATQYFTGSFNGKTFTATDKKTKWIDYGTDNYAGVTWSNVSGAPLFLGWMSNWQYGQLVPTSTWRSAMTIPRRLHLKTVNQSEWLTSEPVKELDKITSHAVNFGSVTIKNSYNLNTKAQVENGQFKLSFAAKKIDDFCIILSNDTGEQFVTGYNKKANQYYTDRTKSGKIDFEKGFAKTHFSPRITSDSTTKLTLIVDRTSAELFADDGLTCITTIFFPQKPYNHIQIKTSDILKLDQLKLEPIQSIWKK